jgi:surface protein
MMIRFSNLDLSRWNVGEVTDMGSMFSSAHGFNSDISGWDVSKVTSMNTMFYYARNFTGDLSRWDVGEVTDMSYMFYEAESFNSDISGWDVSKVRQMYSMFERAVAFSQDITGWSFDDSAYADDYHGPGHTYVYAERMFSGATGVFRELHQLRVRRLGHQRVHGDVRSLGRDVRRAAWRVGGRRVHRVH